MGPSGLGALLILCLAICPGGQNAEALGVTRPRPPRPKVAPAPVVIMPRVVIPCRAEDRKAGRCR